MPPSWETSDDRVRGGSSHSQLWPLDDNRACFHGRLDIKTLGGAGFASQFSPKGNDSPGSHGTQADRTLGSIDVQAWDLSAYAGIEVGFAEGDNKVYTLILRDDISPGDREDGRAKAGINWEG